MNLIYYFFSGLFTFNSIPHLVKGITGQTHMTPFKRISSPYLNIVWGFVNIIIGSLFLGLANQTSYLVSPFGSNITGINLLVFLAGGILISFMDAQLFSKPNARLPWQKD